jgi:hypothetical protein
MMIDSHTSVSGHAIAVGVKTPLRISIVYRIEKNAQFNNANFHCNFKPENLLN